jgi:hypothetical protein
MLPGGPANVGVYASAAMAVEFEGDVFKLDDMIEWTLDGQLGADPLDTGLAPLDAGPATVDLELWFTRFVV